MSVLKPVKPAAVASVTAEELRTLDLGQLGRIVHRTWKRPYFGAVPYLQALCELESIDHEYGCDPGRQIVAYFLSNAQTWKGPDAKLVKAELNRRLKSRAA